MAERKEWVPEATGCDCKDCKPDDAALALRLSLARTDTARKRPTFTPGRAGNEVTIYASDYDVIRAALVQQPAAEVEHTVDLSQCSQVTRHLIRELIQRDAHGRAKYGTTLDREDLAPEQWLQHMKEELLDGAGYAEACIRKLHKSKENI